MNIFKTMLLILALGFSYNLQAEDLPEITNSQDNNKNTERWEYNCIVIRVQAGGLLKDNIASETITEMNNLGKDGWELITADHGLYCFKRTLKTNKE